MYAIFETGGKQYTAKVGDVLFIEKLNANVDETVTFEKVLAVGDAAMTFGTPYVEGVTVSGKVLKNGKGKKITVMTYRPKKDSKRKMGHRQPYTKVEITAVGAVAEEIPAASGVIFSNIVFLLLKSFNLINYIFRKEKSQ